MKNSKNILVALIVILVIILGGAYFLPEHYEVTNTVEINKPADVVYAELVDFNKWGQWAPWKAKDPNAVVNIYGTPGVKGHKMTWEGEVNGMGSMTLVFCRPSDALMDKVNFEKPHKAYMEDHWKLENENGKTKVSWTSMGWWRYPVGRLKGLAFGKKVQSEVDGIQKEGLDNLKKTCEAMVAPGTAILDSSATTNTAAQ